MSIPSYYFKEKFIKMGKWSLLPADSENWHGEHTSFYFKKIFGFNKGTTIIHTRMDDLQHPYYPEFFIKKIYKFIADSNRRDYKSLAQKLLGFYNLKRIAQKQIPKITVSDFTKISSTKLISLYKKNRDWAHRVTPYDQFGWIAEDYWNPVMEKILTSKYGLVKNSVEYYKVLFALTKPEKISTTLAEKREVLKSVIQLKIGSKKLSVVSASLAKNYGFMPVFTFGTPWGIEYYNDELKQISKGNLSVLKREYEKLLNYTKIRNQEFKATVNKYKISIYDQQIFIDFGLALDVRNEAEYLVSLAGYYLLPMYDEIARRLVLSVKQVRYLYEYEIILALQGKIDPEKVLTKKGQIMGWGFNKEMSKRYFFTNKEAQQFFKHVESYVKNLQGGDEQRGLCANNGVVRGMVKIVVSPEQNNKVKVGDILITHATTVDYLPAMKRAAAFVTEVGGLTCHAAVVAREFGVPCIVALTNATKNFKDGDFVEVNAGSGTIKKIK